MAEGKPAAVWQHNLRLWREWYGLTQDDVANRLGLHKTAISRWEAGLREIGLPDLQRLAAIYGVHFALLIEDPSDARTIERLLRYERVNRLLDPAALDLHLQALEVLAGFAPEQAEEWGAPSTPHESERAGPARLPNRPPPPKRRHEPLIPVAAE